MDTKLSIAIKLMSQLRINKILNKISLTKNMKTEKMMAQRKGFLCKYLMNQWEKRKNKSSQMKKK